MRGTYRRRALAQRVHAGAVARSSVRGERDEIEQKWYQQPDSAVCSPYTFDPIGVVRSPFGERADAPRQAALAPDAAGRIELFAGRGFEDALEGLAGWDYAWVIFVFHRNVEEGRGFRPKVLPPRSETKRGVFGTRSPHRPNPIGLSAVKIDRVEGLVVHVRHLDVLDGSPVLDLKPYVAYADAYPEARAGWLESRDPMVAWEVAFEDRAREEITWLHDGGVDLEPKIAAALALGPQPHAYRRIRPHGDGMRLALKEWRVDFRVEGRRLVVTAIRTGYRPQELAADSALAMHRAFTAAFTARFGE